jgi:hypothetical protein
MIVELWIDAVPLWMPEPFPLVESDIGSACSPVPEKSESPERSGCALLCPRRSKICGK